MKEDKSGMTFTVFCVGWKEELAMDLHPICRAQNNLLGDDHF